MVGLARVRRDLQVFRSELRGTEGPTRNSACPYLASRGLLWLQRTDDLSLADEELKDYLRQSYALVAAALTRKARRELGLEPS
jgi:predicted DNA-binding protein (MmcQ/YjbR family)